MNNDLMAKLMNAKKVMNKVESGNFSKGHVNKANLQKDPEELLSQMSAGNMGTLSEENFAGSEPKGLPQLSGEMYQQKVSESRLPPDIKLLMMENHIPQPELNFGSSLDLAFAEKVSKQMEKQGLKKPKQATPVAPQKPQRIDEDMLNHGNIAPATSTLGLNEAILSEMKPLIKEIIQSTLEATIERVLTEKLAKMEQTTKMNEQLQIRVGDSVFVGKIMAVKTKK